MEHLVRFTTAEGRDGHHYAESLDAALAFVERLRNSEEASDVRVFRLREVPIEFRAYYKVEIRPEAELDEPVPPVAPIEDKPEPAPRPLVATAAGYEPDSSDGGARRLFQRG